MAHLNESHSMQSTYAAHLLYVCCGYIGRYPLHIHKLVYMQGAGLGQGIHFLFSLSTTSCPLSSSCSSSLPVSQSTEIRAIAQNQRNIQRHHHSYIHTPLSGPLFLIALAIAYKHAPALFSKPVLRARTN